MREGAKQHKHSINQGRGWGGQHRNYHRQGGENKGRGSLSLSMILEALPPGDYCWGGGAALVHKTDFLADIIMVGL
jgi:hypothetical protein